MNKLQKFLLSLTKKERKLVDSILEKIELGEFDNLNRKKLRGYSNLYRIKKGDFRVTYIKEDTLISIISISRRNEKTYKKYLSFTGLIAKKLI